MGWLGFSAGALRTETNRARLQATTRRRMAIHRRRWDYPGRGWGSVTFKARGDVYAVNGLAKGQGFKDIEPIWADDPETGSKKNIGPIIDRGLALCA